ncbi:hypothetical protein MTO96_019616 [Rhipicephalus appendiculatus]
MHGVWARETQGAAHNAISVLSDVLASLRIFGIGPFESKETVKGVDRGRKTTSSLKSTGRSRVFSVFLHLWLARLLLKLIMVFLGKGKVGETGVEFLRTMAATYAFNRVASYRPRICHLLWSLDKIQEWNVPLGRLPQYARLYTRGVWFYLFLRVAVDICQVPPKFARRGFNKDEVRNLHMKIKFDVTRRQERPPIVGFQAGWPAIRRAPGGHYSSKSSADDCGYRRSYG